MKVGSALSSAAVLDAVRDGRRPLTGYCTRMLGSPWDADDAVQETMVRAWNRRHTFEGRSSVESWLYRIATNVCLDMLRAKRRRPFPVDLDAPEALAHDQDLGAGVGGAAGAAGAARADPADTVARRESVRHAFLVALQALPARQRSVLILRDVLRWTTPEVAELLGTTPASVNSALQRARATLAARRAAAVDAGVDAEAVVPTPLGLDAEDRSLLAGLVAAFERHDIPTLVGELRAGAA